MKKGDRILDVGCGRGDFTEGFKELGMSVYAIDAEKSIHNTSTISVNIVDVEKEVFPFADSYFDFTFSKSVVEHIWDPEHFIKEQLRTLKTGGKLICLTPDWISQLYIFYNDHTHKRPYTTEGMKDLLKIMGLKDVESQLFYQLPYVWKYPRLGFLSRMLGILGPVRKLYKNKFIRWSRERMILATGIK